MAVCDLQLGDIKVTAAESPGILFIYLTVFFHLFHFGTESLKWSQMDGCLNGVQNPNATSVETNRRPKKIGEDQKTNRKPLPQTCCDLRKRQKSLPIIQQSENPKSNLQVIQAVTFFLPWLEVTNNL